jgi:hypothetical protein
MRWDDDNWNGPADFLGNPDVPVVFHGSLGNADRIVRLDRWEPGAYCNTEGFRCSSWLDALSRWALNSNATYTTVGRLVASSEHAREQFGSRVFVRPDSPLKPFSGRVVALTGLLADHLDHGFYYDDIELPVVVSSVVKDLGREWRFVVCRDSIVAHSEYVAEGRKALDGAPPDDVVRVATEVAAAFDAPDPIYILDVVETRAGPRLLEVNPFSGADLYRCDPDAVVAAVSSLVP